MTRTGAVLLAAWLLGWSLVYWRESVQLRAEALYLTDRAQQLVNSARDGCTCRSDNGIMNVQTDREEPRWK